jgi:mRNA interferase RelE/StbE
MGDHRITLARSARKELEALPASVLARVWSRIEGLAAEPRPRGSRKIRGARSLWRLRVGDYRVIYTVDDQHRLVDVVAVRHRSSAYA